MNPRLLAFAAVGLFWAGNAAAQLTIDYSFTLNSTVPDNNQQGLADNRTLGGLSSFTVNSVSLNLTSPNGADPMFLGDLYSSLTYGLASEGPRTGVLLNRVGRDDGTTGGNVFGSSLSSFNPTFNDGAASNVWGATATSGTFRPDGRLISPNTAPIPFAEQGSPNNLGTVGGSAYTSNNYSLLVADVAAGGTARLNGWTLSVTGTAAGGAVSAGTGGTYAITGTGSNNLSATVDTNGGTLAGGALSVNITGGTTTFSGVVSGANGIVKSGTGTLILSNGSNSYAGGTTFGGGVTEFASGALGSTGNLTFTTNGSLRYGSGNTQDVSGRIVNSTSAVSIDTNGNNVTFASAIGSSNTGGLTKSGSGTLTLGGGNNNFTGATTVSGGTLQVNAGSSLSATASVVLNGGTLLLNASNQVNSTAPAFLNGGTLDLSTNGTSQTLGALTLSATSIINLGAGVSDSMTFAASNGTTWNGAAMLRIYNWSGTAANGTVYGSNNDVLNFSTATGLNAGQLAQVGFYSDDGTTFLGEGVILPDGTVVPIPEPMTWLGGALALGLLGRRLRTLRRGKRGP